MTWNTGFWRSCWWGLEYADSLVSRGVRSLKNGRPGYDSKENPEMKLKFPSSGRIWSASLLILFWFGVVVSEKVTFTSEIIFFKFVVRKRSKGIPITVCKQIMVIQYNSIRIMWDRNSVRYSIGIAWDIQ